jgi:hypothetical protein
MRLWVRRKYIPSLWIILAMMVALPATGFGEVPQQISCQGSLTNEFGVPLNGDNYRGQNLLFF